MYFDKTIQLLDYIQENDYKGWDPYDGLNSLIFRNSPFYKIPFFRLCWIQLFKRSPINLRRLLLVPKERNPKGIALCASGLFNLFKLTNNSRYKNEAVKLLEWLDINYSKGYSGKAWGYNFPWQSRFDFKKKYFPTIVTTSFVANSFFDGYVLTKNKNFLATALSASEFILHDLNIYQENKTICFSYGPEDKSVVYNATALGAQFLAQLYTYEHDNNFLTIAKKSLQFVAGRQNNDGSWFYGDVPSYKWIDNFHTGYILIALKKYQEVTGDSDFSGSIEKGYTFYTKTLFNKKHEPKYYSNRTYPLDIHSYAVSILTLSEFNDIDLAAKVLDNVYTTLWHRKGYFRYQIHKKVKNSIPYMRWSQAWMFLALSLFLEKSQTKELLKK